jgi:hypothetical protein
LGIGNVVWINGLRVGYLDGWMDGRMDDWILDGMMDEWLEFVWRDIGKVAWIMIEGLNIWMHGWMNG